LRIVDYKTGSSSRYRLGAKDAPLKGGRMLQPALYSAGAEQAHGASVREFEYRFPKERTLFDRVRLSKADIAQAPMIVGSLLSHLRHGTFLPTDDIEDCAYCDFRDICQVSGERQDTSSPRAEWGKRHGEQAPEYVQLRSRRSPSGAGDVA
jgi:CRISPR/Cas system-associated exonuclease Cas4 (RecB family)